VLSALGVVGKGTVLSDGTKNILRQMEGALIRRFVCMSALGVGDSRAQVAQLGFVFSRIILPLFLRDTYADKETQERYVRDSQTDWTLVRAAVLTDGPRTGRYRSGFTAQDQGIAGKISRADVAAFMIEQLQNDTFLKQAVSLSS
jgi:putative NADH-flavin reductase